MRFLLAALLMLAAPATASADWLFSPFIGYSFAADTNYIRLEDGAGESKFTVGGAVAYMSAGVFGVEADLGYGPGFFEGEQRGGLVTSSKVATLTANVVVTAPLSFTRESLRPYLTAGVGWMHANAEDVSGIFPLDRHLLALSVGGGAIGFIDNRYGFRFDLRRFQNLSYETAELNVNQRTRLSFWRATVGVTIRH